MRRVSGLLLTVLLCGCAGSGLVQTAKTTAPGETRAALSESLANNDRSDGASDSPEARSWKIVGVQVDYRAGVTEHVDMGVGTFLIGLRADVKVDLAEPTDSWGFAPRGGIGIGTDFAFGNVAAPFAGVVASWEPWRALALYGGLSFTNYWIMDTDRPSWATDEPGSREASSTGWGDGVVQLSAGLAFFPRGTASFFMEYGLLQPAQDDPSDYYRFVRSHLAVVGLAF